MKKAFICAHANFPRGGAEANYIEYLALALKDIGYEVYVFSRGTNRKCDWVVSEECYQYNGIIYENIEENYNLALQCAKEYFVEGKKVCKLLNKYNAKENDIVITYSTNYFYIKCIHRYTRKRNMQLITTVVEWYQSFQFKYGILNPVYWLEQFGFEYGIPMSGKVLPISSYLERHFKEKGCKTLCLPIMANIGEIPIFERKKRRDKLNFIYSGNPFQKDAIDVILDSFCALSDEERKKVKLHFTGMSKSTLTHLKKKYGRQMKILEDILIVHEWLSYEELIELYKEIDYLVLFRHKNKVTLANFPSKVPEMMSYGIIPIVSDVGDYTQKFLRDNFDCLMLNENTPYEGRKKIKQAMELTEGSMLDLNRNVINTVKDKFDYHNWITYIEKFIDEE